ncbi:hypothetical protein [Acidocella sp.]|uniref:hypothetical protein n=1 Tax=Acidocella sp. TaxID=50710 RepID=UPI002F40E852
MELLLQDMNLLLLLEDLGADFCRVLRREQVRLRRGLRMDWRRQPGAANRADDDTLRQDLPFFPPSATTAHESQPSNR